MSLLSVVGLNKSFGTLVVTQDISLEVELGERRVIIGPNGAGKTSLLNQIGGQLKSDSGRISLNGRDVTGSAPDRMCGLGVARTFQKNNLFQNLSVIENVRLPLQMKLGNIYNPITGVDRIPALFDRAAELLSMVGLEQRRSVLVKHLSYGEQREVELACALASDPILLLLDEPTSGLSHAETNRMIERIATLPRSIAIMMIEHDLNAVFSIADNISVLHYGRLVATGTQKQISDNKLVREIYLGGQA